MTVSQKVKALKLAGATDQMASTEENYDDSSAGCSELSSHMLNDESPWPSPRPTPRKEDATKLPVDIFTPGNVGKRKFSGPAKSPCKSPEEQNSILRSNYSRNRADSISSGVISGRPSLSQWWATPHEADFMDLPIVP